MRSEITSRHLPKPETLNRDVFVLQALPCWWSGSTEARKRPLYKSADASEFERIHGRSSKMGIPLGHWGPRAMGILEVMAGGGCLGNFLLQPQSLQNKLQIAARAGDLQICCIVRDALHPTMFVVTNSNSSCIRVHVSRTWPTQ